MRPLATIRQGICRTLAAELVGLTFARPGPRDRIAAALARYEAPNQDDLHDLLPVGAYGERTQALVSAISCVGTGLESGSAAHLMSALAYLEQYEKSY